ECWRGTSEWERGLCTETQRYRPPPLFFFKCQGGVRRYEDGERARQRRSEGTETQQRRENKPLLHNLSSTAKVSSPQACTTNLTGLALQGGMSVLCTRICVCLVLSWYDIMIVDSLALSDSLRVSDMRVVFGTETKGSWVQNLFLVVTVPLTVANSNRIPIGPPCQGKLISHGCRYALCKRKFCLHYSRRGIAAELNLPIWTPSTPSVFMHAGKHRIGCCPSRQPLRTRCLCKYIRWVHVQQSDTKEVRSCCNPPLWRRLCSSSCLPSLSIEYLNSLVTHRDQKKKKKGCRASIIHFYIFLGWPSYMYCPTRNVYTLGYSRDTSGKGDKKRAGETEDKKSTPQMGLFGQNKMYTN
ncbi:hypothetical protein PO909_006991, partial [Leuciscus waleckii]